jgi:autotransporter translocation and assembly factor TamB
MLSTSPRAARIRLLVAFAIVLAIGGVIWGIGALRGGGPMSGQQRALIEAFEQKTGLALSVQKSELDATAGSWRGLDVELRPRGAEGPLARPVLSASVVELKLDAAALLRGEVRIERALLHDAVLNVDRRGAAKSAFDAKALLASLPASIEAPRSTIVVHHDQGHATLAGISVVAQRAGDGARGTLEGKAATLDLQSSGKPVELSLNAGFDWQSAGFAVSALEVKRGQSAFKGDAKLGGEAELVRLRAEPARLEDLGGWLEPWLGADAKGQGRIELELSAKAANARFDLRDAAVHGVALSRVQGVLERVDEGVRVRELVAQHGEARLRSDALSVDAHGIQDGELHVERLALRSTLTALFGSVPADGTAAGTLRFSRVAAGEPGVVGVQLALDAPSISGYRFDSGQLRAVLALAGASEPGVKIEALELVGKTARLKAHGSASPSGRIALEVSGQLSLGKEQLQGQGKVSGSWAQPETTASLGSSGSGPLVLQVRLSGKDIREGTLELRSADFGARMPALEHAGAPHGVASARIALSRGRIDDVRSFEGKGELSEVVLGYGERRFKSAAGVPLALERGRVELRGLTLVDQAAGDTRWNVEGAIDLDRGLDLTVRGQLPLAHLLSTTPFIGAVEGRADVKLSLAGPLDAPRVRGEAETRDAQLEVGPAKLPWREVSATMILTDRELAFQQANGKLGGGTLSLGGGITLDGIKARRVELKLALKKLSVTPEPRFEVELGADATLRWKAGDKLPVLGGVIDLTRLHYGRHVQLPEAVIAIGRSKKAERAPTLALDLYVTHSAPITIRNDFLDAELAISSAPRGAHEEIHVVGTDTQVGVLGELSVTRGRALFRGATLTIRRGRIALISDDRIVPSLELEADAPAKRRPGGVIAFRAKGDPQKFDLTLRCEAKDGGRVPAVFACDYAGDAMRCGAFEELTALWACQPPL